MVLYVVVAKCGRMPWLVCLIILAFILPIRKCGRMPLFYIQFIVAYIRPCHLDGQSSRGRESENEKLGLLSPVAVGMHTPRSSRPQPIDRVLTCASPDAAKCFAAMIFSADERNCSRREGAVNEIAHTHMQRNESQHFSFALFACSPSPKREPSS